MNFRKCTFLIAIIISFIAIGCKKSSNPVVPNVELKGIYQASNTENLSGVFMYTANGQVTNQDTIKAYIARHNRLIGDSLFVFNSTIKVETNGTQVDFTGNDKAQFFNGNKAALFNVLQRSPTGFLLQAADSSFRLVVTDSSPSEMLINNANTIDMLIDCKPIASSTGFNEVCTFHQKYSFIIKDGQIYLSLFSCAVTYFSSNIISGNSVGNVPGSFNAALNKQLITGDTLIYQSKNILLKKN